MAPEWKCCPGPAPVTSNTCKRYDSPTSKDKRWGYVQAAVGDIICLVAFGHGCNVIQLRRVLGSICVVSYCCVVLVVFCGGEQQGSKTHLSKPQQRLLPVV